MERRGRIFHDIRKSSHIMEGELEIFHGIRKKLSYRGRGLPKPSMIYGKNPISWNQRSKPSMIYGKNPISWNPASKPSMIYQIIPIPWNPNNPQKIIPWYKGKLSTPWNYYCPANPSEYSSSRPQVGPKSAPTLPPSTQTPCPDFQQ